MKPALGLPALVVGIGFLFNFVGRGVAEAWSVFLLPIEDEFGWRRQDVTAVYSAFLLVNGLVAPFTGMLFDRLGPRACYGAGLALLAAATLAASFAAAQWHFYARVGVAFGIATSAIGMVPASVMIGRWFGVALGRAIAIAYAGFGTGVLLLVPLSQWLIEGWGWRAAYRVLGTGFVLLLAGAMLLPWRRIAAGSPAVAAARAGAGGRRDTPAAHGVASALRTREFWLLVQVFHFTAIGMYLVIPQTVAYLVDRGFAPLAAATLFGTAGMLSTAGIMGAGWLADRVGFKFAASASFACTLAGTGCLAALQWSGSPWWVAGFVLLFGIAQGARGPIVSTLSNRFFAGPSTATIYGVVYLAMALGAALGAWGSGVLHDLTGGYGVAFALSALAIVVAAAPFWLTRRLEWRAAPAASQAQ